MNLNYVNIHNNPFYKIKKELQRKSNNYQVNNIKMKKKKLEFEINSMLNDHKKPKSILDNVKKFRTLPNVDMGAKNFFLNPLNSNLDKVKIFDIPHLIDNKINMRINFGDGSIYQNILAKSKFNLLIKNKNLNFNKNFLEGNQNKIKKVLEIRNQFNSLTNDNLQENKKSLNDILNEIDCVDLDNIKYNKFPVKNKENKYNNIFLTEHRKSLNEMKVDNNLIKIDQERKSNYSLPNKLIDNKRIRKINFTESNEIKKTSKNSSIKLQPINLNSINIYKHRRFINKSDLAVDNIRARDDNAYEPNKISEPFAIIRSKFKFKPLKRKEAKESVIRSTASKVLKIANENKQNIKEIIKKYKLPSTI